MVDELIFVLASVLAAILAITGLAKLRNVSAFGAILTTTYGVPQPLSRLAGMVPLVELVIAASLVAPATRPIGFLGAAALLGAAGILASLALVQGRSGDCGCLGDARPEPLRPATGIRAFSLAAVGAVGALASSHLQWTVSAVHTNLDLVLLGTGVVILAVLATSIARLALAVGEGRGRFHS